MLEEETALDGPVNYMELSDYKVTTKQKLIFVSINQKFIITSWLANIVFIITFSKVPKEPFIIVHSYYFDGHLHAWINL